MPKSKPSEVEIVAMAIAWATRRTSNSKSPEAHWNAASSLTRRRAIVIAEDVLRALRGGR